jgi:hypothetical protein
MLKDTKNISQKSNEINVDISKANQNTRSHSAGYSLNHPMFLIESHSKDYLLRIGAIRAVLMEICF